MIDSFVLLAPVLLIPVVGLVCFVGCDRVFGLTRVPDGPAPTGFTATPGDGKIVLSWDAYPDATDYLLRRGEASGMYTATFNLGKVTGFTDSNLSNGTEYFYVLKASPSLPSEEISAIPTAAALIAFVTSFVPADVVTTLSGWFGLKLVVGSEPITVKTLGRAFSPGNSQIHVIKIVDASGADTSAFASVSMAGGVDGEFKYGTLSTPATLTPGTSYFIVSQETSGQDGFYNHNLTLTTTDAATVPSSARGGPPYTADNPGLHSYGPVNFQY